MAQSQEVALSRGIFRLSFSIFHFQRVSKGKMRNGKWKTINGKCFASLLETEPDRRVDTAIVCSVTAAKPAEAPARRRRLSEQARSDVTDRIVEVDVVQQVVEVH
jgi:hypothetical protein